MIFFDWKEYTRKYFFKELPSFRENNEKNENDFLNFYLCYQYHYIVSSYFHFINETELKKKTSIIKYIINEKDLKVYFMTLKNIPLPILIKYIMNNLQDYQYKNEYYIGLYGINELRSMIPNFSYCFYQIPKDKQIQTIFEYVEGITFFEYLNQFKTKKDFCISTEGQKFLSIIFQITCSLETAQQTLHFTHFDLHEKNILLRDSKQTNNLVYTIFNKTYQVQTSQVVATLIDFEYSCIRKKDYIISKVNPDVFKYGYYSIFIPGTDLLRLFLNMKYTLLRYSNDTTTFLSYIHEFIDYVLQNFFNIKFQYNYKKSLYYHCQYFFNMAITNRVYKNPYSFLLFLEKNKKIIYQMFDIKSVVWKTVDPVETKIYNCSDIQKYVSLDNCSEPSIKSLYSYLRNTETIIDKTNEGLVKYSKMVLETEVIPNIIQSNLRELKSFFNRNRNFKNCYEYYFNKYFILKKKSACFLFENEKNCKDATMLYRILCSIEYMILLKEKYSETEYTYNEIDKCKISYLCHY